MYFKCQKNAKNELSVTNRVYFNPNDWQTHNKYVQINSNAKKFVFQADIDPTVNKGNISMGVLQRKWIYCGVSENIFCDPINLNDNQIMSEVVVEVDLFSKNTVVKEPLDTEKMAMNWLQCFVENAFTVGQMILFAFDDVNLSATIKSIKVLDLTNNQEITHCYTAVYTANTVVRFCRKSDSRLMLIGRCTDESQTVNIISSSWDFNSIGVGGVDAEFQELFRRAFLSRLLPPSYIEKLAIRHVRGMLLYGPPGTGKTLMARQIGKMLNAREPKIVNGPSILDKYVGESEANIRRLFAEAEEEFKKMGNNSALHIIIFDEIDAICKQRGSLAGSGSGVQDTVVNQLLSKMDGVEQLNNILVIGMTNRRDMIDEALLRPGRMEVQIEISLPDEPGRLQIFEIHTKKLKEAGILADDVSLAELAKLAKNFSGAEIEGLVKAALSNAQMEIFDPKKEIAVKQDDLKQFKIKRAHFLYAIEHDIKPFFASKDTQMEEFYDAPIIHWGERMKDLLYKASIVVNSITRDETMRRTSLLVHGPSKSGLTSLAVYLAKSTEFPFVRMCSLNAMIGFSESARTLAIKKAFDDALRAPASVIILDDIEMLVDYASIGPRFSVTLVNSLINLIKVHVPAGKKLFVIGTTHKSREMRELDVNTAFTNQLAVPIIKKPDEALMVLQDLDVFTDEDIQQLQSAIPNQLSIGVKTLVEQARKLRILDSVDRVRMLVQQLDELNSSRASMSGAMFGDDIRFETMR